MVRRGLFTGVFANNISALAYILHFTSVACIQSACSLVLAACCLIVCLKGAGAGRSAGSLLGAMVRVWNSWVSLQWQRGLFGWPGSLLKTKHIISAPLAWTEIGSHPAYNCCFLSLSQGVAIINYLHNSAWHPAYFIIEKYVCSLRFHPQFTRNFLCVYHLSSSCIHAG